jgi:hypothetical protein
LPARCEESVFFSEALSAERWLFWERYASCRFSCPSYLRGVGAERVRGGERGRDGNRDLREGFER